MLKPNMARPKAGYRSTSTAMALYALLTFVVIGLTVPASADINQLQQAQIAIRTHNYTDAHRLLDALADEGHSKAQYLLGLLYMRGLGVSKNYAQSARYLEQSARQNNAKAQFELALLYEKGQGVKQNFDIASQWLIKARDNGYSRAEKALKRINGKRSSPAEESENLFSYISSNQLYRLNRALRMKRPMIDTIHPQMGGNTLLTFAIEKQNRAAADVIIDQGADTNVARENGQAPLHIATLFDDSQMIKRLLVAGSNPDVKVKTGNTPLHIAARKNNMPIATILLDNQASINIANNSGDYPLDMLSTQETTLMEYLSSRGGSKSPLRHAKPDDEERISALANNVDKLLGASNQDSASYSGWPAINIAAWSGDLTLVTELLKINTKIDDHDSGNMTALGRAANRGHEEMVKLLLANGADPLFGENFMLTPLSIAVRQDHEEIVKLLFDQLPSERLVTSQYYILVADSIDNQNEAMALLLLTSTPAEHRKRKQPKLLLMAVEHGLIKLTSNLLKQGWKTEFTDVNGATPLWLAARNNHLEIAQMLIKAGANIDASDKDKNSVLMASIINGADAITSLLLKQPVDLTAENHLGDTALALAAKKGLTVLTQQLLDQGADIKKRNKQSATPLMLAIINGHLETVKILLDAGAQPKRRNSKGQNALQIAEAAGATEIENYLKGQ